MAGTSPLRRSAAARSLEVVARREVVVEAGRIDEAGDAPAATGSAGRTPEEAYLALGRLDEAEDSPDRGALTAPVGTEEPVHVPLAHLEAEGIHRDEVPELLGEAPDLKYRSSSTVSHRLTGQQPARRLPEFGGPHAPRERVRHTAVAPGEDRAHGRGELARQDPAAEIHDRNLQLSSLDLRSYGRSGSSSPPAFWVQDHAPQSDP